MNMNSSKSNKFVHSKEKYYKNIKTLLDKIDTSISTDNEINPIPSLDIGNFSSDFQNKKVIEEKSPVEECQICKEKSSKYTCPKCKIKYCGVECYKKHNMNCTEDFYKRNVEQVLKNEKVDEDQSKKFRRTLKDYYDKINLDKEENNKGAFLSEEREQHLLKILEKIENGNLNMARDLTPYDWTEFNKFVSGYMENSEEFKIWKPFWESKVKGLEPSLQVYDLNLFKDYDNLSLQTLKELEINDFIENKEKDKSKSLNDIETMEELLEFENNDSINHNPNYYITLNDKSIPITREIIYKSILLKFKDTPHLSNLSKVKPNLKNIYTLVNICLYVVFVYRLYNGEVTDNDNIEEVVSFLLDSCKILHDKNTVFENINLCLTNFLEAIRKIQGSSKFFDETEKMVIFDLKTLLRNKFYIFESFLRLYEILHKFSRRLENANFLTGQKFKNWIKILNLAKHKIIYFLSYIKDMDFSQELLQEVVIEKINEFYLEKSNNKKLGNLIQNKTNKGE
jgi:hypothetical protein